jgi:type IV pilus assembly protein PilC
MPNFSYKAVNPEGKYVKGKITADNSLNLESVLNDYGLELISFKKERSSLSGSLSTKIKTKDMVTMLLHLEQLDKAGVSIIDSLEDVIKSSSSPNVKNLTRALHESVQNGALLSEAMAEFPKIFDEVFIGLVSTSEQTGKLHKAFEGLIEHLKWSSEIKRKTIKATRYPLFTLIVGLIVMSIMTTVVVPQVTNLLQSTSDGQLPTLTKSLIAFSKFLKSNGLNIIFGTILTIMLYKIGRVNARFSYYTDIIKLKLPFFGPLFTKLDASRFAHFFAMTFNSGMGVIECLESSKSIIANKAIRKSINIAIRNVEEGNKLAKAIEKTGYFPSLVVSIITIGEDSGELGNSLMNVRFFYDREINDSIDKLIGTIQPGLTLIMGGMIAWIAMAVFGPIYNSFSKFK